MPQEHLRLGEVERLAVPRAGQRPSHGGRVEVASRDHSCRQHTPGARFRRGGRRPRTFSVLKEFGAEISLDLNDLTSDILRS